jgi:hypothetical protein
VGEGKGKVNWLAITISEVSTKVFFSATDVTELRQLLCVPSDAPQFHVGIRRDSESLDVHIFLWTKKFYFAATTEAQDLAAKPSAVLLRIADLIEDLCGRP